MLSLSPMRSNVDRDILALTMQERDEVTSVVRWISDARTGDAKAAGRLYKHFRPTLLSYVKRRMGSRAQRWTDPEDIAQRVLIEVFRGLGSLPEDADEDDVWRRLFRTAAARITDEVRRHQKSAGESVVEVAVEAQSTASQTGTITRLDDRRWLHELIAHLPPDYRDVMQLCAVEGVSYDEAARRLGVNHWTVRKRFERARNSLIRRFQKQDSTHE